MKKHDDKVLDKKVEELSNIATSILYEIDKRNGDIKYIKKSFLILKRVYKSFESLDKMIDMYKK